MNRSLNKYETVGTSLRWLQKNQPWEISYDVKFHNGGAHRPFAHCLLHIQKSLGKLAAIAEKLDHDSTYPIDDNMKQEIASIIVSAIRAANVFPSGRFDIQDATIILMETKNQVKLGRHRK